MEETILLVDDEEGIRKVLGITLEDSGYVVHTAENGNKALEIFNDVHPSIVLTDIKMPGISGIDLLQKIKRESPETEVIMITGHGDMELAIKSLKYEATDFITKPIDDDLLEIALKRARERISMRKQLKEYTENLEVLVQVQSAKLVEAERLTAVGQAVEGISSAIKDLSGDLAGGIAYFNEMPCFVAIHNHDLKIVATNQLFKDRFGDKIGARSWEIYRSLKGDSESCPVKDTFKTGKGLRRREMVHFIDGREGSVIVHTAPIRSKDGAPELVLEITADITEVKRLREKLRNTEQRYQQLFDEAPCYITVQDKDFMIVAANRFFKNDFGEGIGFQCYKIYKNRQEPCSDCPVSKTFDDGKSHDSEMTVTDKSGQQVNLLIRTAPILNSAGDVAQVMEMATNITEIRKLQDHLTSLGLQIGSISHGIKGLLTGLDGGMYMLSSGFSKENQDRIQEGWEVVKVMIERIRKMILNILYYAKERELEWENVHVVSFVKDVALTVEPKIQGHDIEFIKDFDCSTDRFTIDPGVVSSALVNILENAIDACIEDPSKPSHQVIFRVHQQEGDILFEVEDNGIGMDEETQKKIFSLFFSSKGHKGTGLGLHISDKIIRQHGGSIQVTSSVGKGTLFRIRVPKSLP